MGNAYNLAAYTQEHLLPDLEEEPSRASLVQALYRGAGSAEELMRQADPRDGWLRVGMADVRVSIAAKHNELSPIRYRFGSWAVTTYGVECLSDYFPIPKSRLHSDHDWTDRLSEAPWVCLRDLVRALVVARHLYPADPEVIPVTHPWQVLP